ncbi:malto-oligosyltrehalose synthase [Streptomyces sp. 3MP-14]|uniref:Malto-oligosyltrehalose synthase n=1 Tax=Streptomyces mimosae TaxID=2586635 RepID=A0A5N6AID9_9ACTN|nr:MULTISPECIES: malto-oligosyltrehalose synthase [Streptomyces]KAB8167823.1 malto-oligosyltrehalose synthase [Streptomyces mimosae]KAB8177529.1 malto-oligosyltrehalose synthase [Streptomyces sp. 3MP-14]
MTATRVPTSTYRLQLGPDLPFAAAEQVVPHAASLGVSHLHLSPVLDAVPGSGHGYDVTDHTRVRPELGGEEGLRRLAATARDHGLGLVLDIVPNHMALPADTRRNAPLWQVLREGRESPAARWFDIDWDAGDGRVLLPVLGGPLGEELCRLSVDGDTLRYADHLLPLRADTEELPLPDLLDAQHYRLAWWRLGRSEVNYRRFFTISDLIAIRVEDPEIFRASHALVLRLLADGVIDGFRVDHPDGLADPGGYLARLHEETGGAWIVAEKILGSGEQLPGGWPIAGTTGYDALRHLDALFVDPEGWAELTEHYRAFTGAPPDQGGAWEATVRRAAYRMINHELVAERERLVRVALRICRSVDGLRRRDHAPWALRTAITELLVRLPVYRPYATADAPPSPVDEALLATAADGARAAFRVPAEASAVATVRDLALGLFGEDADRADFRVRFAQVSSALRAKAVEDTACYRYTPLLSAAEVGGDPGAPALPPATFHAFCSRTQRDWPLTGTVLSTHDTKRSGDVRAAQATLTERPRDWAALVTQLTEATAASGARAPDPHLAWSTWQTAFGLGSPDRDRLLATQLKTAREAALHTSWTERNEEYEASLERFVLAGPCGQPFYQLAEFAAGLAPAIRSNVLGATLLHLTMPGVPDVYRGSEGHYPALVDPDNRRPPRLPVAQLAALDGAGPAEGHDLATEKLRLTATALRLRRAHPEWFGPRGGYQPLFAEGRAANHCVAFVRADRALTAVTRLSHRLTAEGGWGDTRLALPPGEWRSTLTGQRHRERVELSRLFATEPVALLVNES